MNQKKTLFFVASIFALAGALVGATAVWFFVGGPQFADPSVPLREGAIVQVDEATAQYTNDQYGFSLQYPKALSIAQFNEGNDSATIVFQNKKEEKGFQIFITPYVGDSITPERIKSDIPSGVVEDPVEVLIGNNSIRALHFRSVAPIIGDSSEVWFIYEGNLYEVTAYAGLDSWMAEILRTFEFAN